MLTSGNQAIGQVRPVLFIPPKDPKGFYRAAFKLEAMLSESSYKKTF